MQTESRNGDQLRWTLILIFLFLLWSNSFHAIAWLRKSIDARDLVVARFAPVGLFCLVWFFASGWRENLRILGAHGLRIAIGGLLIVPIYNICLNWGQGQVPAGTAALLIATNPFFTYLIALCVRQEGFAWRKTLGLLVSFAGVYLLLRSQGRSFGAGYLVHAVALLGAPVAWAAATVMGRPLVQRESPLRVLFLSLSVGSIFLVPVACLDQTLIHAARLWHWADWAWLFHLSVMCTIVGYSIFYAALRHLPASSVAAFVLLNPPLTLAFGQLLRTEHLSSSLLGFGALILLGVLVSTWSPRR